jgi:hypothetical protein
MNLRIASLLLLFGWIFLKYHMLGSESTFMWGMMYHFTAMLGIGFTACWIGTRTFRETPEFFEGFKHVAKHVLSYSAGATVSIWVWYHYIIADATLERFNTMKEMVKTQFSSEADYLSYVRENGLDPHLSLSDWITSTTSQIELMYSPQTHISLSLMAYLVLGLFISLIANVLWTKVWFAQQVPIDIR